MRVWLDAAAVSDIGTVRPVNQDAAFTAPWAAVVADGVGGGPSGDLAAAALVHRLAAGSGAVAPDADGLARRIRGANWDLRAHAERDPTLQGMATTLTGLFVSDTGDLLLAHAGDSRAYLLRDGDLTRQTRDDSYVQLLVDRGIIPPEAAATHPHRNVVIASFGGGEAETVSVVTLSSRAGDRWLVCSDGLTDYVADAEIAAVLRRSASAPELASAAVGLALAAGTRDNVTVVVCDVRDAAEEAGPRRSVFSGAAALRFAEGVETA